LGKHVILSRGEDSTGGRSRSSTLADAFEAIIGAVYVDAGFEAARQRLMDLIREGGTEMVELPNLDNPKGDLQEQMQASSPEAPRYELLDTEGPDHDRTFRCAVLHGGIELARGVGRSKKAAESNAAFLALQKLKASLATPAPEGS
jgi:ribonuclease-3